MPPLPVIGRCVRLQIRSRRRVHLAAVSLGLVSSLTSATAWALVADHADDICASSVDPCVVTQQFDIVDGSVLDFATRTVRIANGGQLDTNAGTATVLVGKFQVDSGLSTGIKVRGTGGGGTDGGSLFLKARRRCSADTNVLCLGDSDCPAGTCSVGDGTITILSPVRANSGSNAGAKSGSVDIQSAGDVGIGALVTASSSAADTDGGAVEIRSGGTVTLDGSVTTVGGGLAAGGIVVVRAVNDIVVNQLLDANGGDVNGGLVEIAAGRDVIVNQTVRASSHSGGGFGGDVWLNAGRNLLLTSAGRVEANGHATLGGFAGDGGFITLQAEENVSIAANRTVSANSAGPDGYGGQILVQAGLDALVSGILTARTGGNGPQFGAGGVCEVRSGGMLSFAAGALIDVRGGQAGGGVALIDAAAATLDGTIDARTSNGGTGGDVEVKIAGSATMAGVVRLDGTSDGTRNGRAELEFCELTMKPGAAIQNVGALGSNTLQARSQFALQASASLLADAATGSNTIRYRNPGSPPQLAGTIVPAPSLVVAPELPTCSACGNAVLEQDEECDDGNAQTGDGCRPNCTPEVCGDGIRDPGEECDGGDGPCPSRCTVGCACRPECVTNADCDPDEVCNVGACEPAPGCTSNADCEDDNACTTDTCDTGDGLCLFLDASAACDDGLFCNGEETCNPAGGCQAGAPPNCDDSNLCTTDSCNETGDRCDFTDTSAACDDGLFCNGEETCNPANGCQPGTAPTCDDDNVCTADSCDEAVDDCAYLDASAACSDGSFCNGIESCDPVQGCQPGTPPACNDRNACTADSCNEAAKECQFIDTSAGCSDGQFCNGVETCDPALGCQAGLPLTCSDGNDCTTDSCNEATDTCQNEDVSALCDDGDLCTNDSCDAGFGCLNVFDPANDPACVPVIGRMTGGGRFYLDTEHRDGLTHSFHLDCYPFAIINRLRVGWRAGKTRYRFRLRQVESASCSDNPSIGPVPPDAGFDTHQGSGRGVLRIGRDRYLRGATVVWQFTDAGEPNVADDVSTLIIREPDGSVVLMEASKLFVGNHQTHAR